MTAINVRWKGGDTTLTILEVASHSNRFATIMCGRWSQWEGYPHSLWRHFHDPLYLVQFVSGHVSPAEMGPQELSGLLTPTQKVQFGRTFRQNFVSNSNLYHYTLFEFVCDSSTEAMDAVVFLFSNVCLL